MNIYLNKDNTYSITTKTAFISLDPIHKPGKDILFTDDALVIFSSISSLFTNSNHSSLWVRGPGEYELQNVRVVGTAYSNNIQQSTKVKTTYLLEADKISVYYLGAFSGKLDSKALQELENVDVVIADLTREDEQIVSEVNLVSQIRSLEPSVIVLNGWDNKNSEPLPQLNKVANILGKTQIEPITKLNLSSNSIAKESDLRIEVLKSKD